MSINKVRVICCDVCTRIGSGYLVGEDFHSIKQAKHWLTKKGWTFIKTGCPCCDGDYCPDCTEERVKVYGESPS